MQFLSFTKDSVRVYHTRKEFELTDKFECGGEAPLTGCTPVLDPQGNVTDYLVVQCPACAMTGCAPLTGDTEAQRLHAHVRLANPKHPAKTLAAAIKSVVGDIAERGGHPSDALMAELSKASG